jgi:hypothetical protein
VWQRVACRAKYPRGSYFGPSGEGVNRGSFAWVLSASRKDSTKFSNAGKACSRKRGSYHQGGPESRQPTGQRKRRPVKAWLWGVGALNTGNSIRRRVHPACSSFPRLTGKAGGCTAACRLLTHRTCGARASTLGGGGARSGTHQPRGRRPGTGNGRCSFKTVFAMNHKRMRHSAFPGGRPPQYWQSLAGLNC